MQLQPAQYKPTKSRPVHLFYICVGREKNSSNTDKCNKVTKLPQLKQYYNN